MLGGGNPGQVPELVEQYRLSLAQIAKSDDSIHRTLGSYGEPAGSGSLVHALVELFNSHYGWSLSDKNIVLTNGSQNAFFLLFNLFAGPAGSSHKKILLPLTPEYIGYTDVPIHTNFFTANRPLIDRIDERRFKYRVDFETLAIPDDTGAICLSRPTNPTGNVVTNEELSRLDDMAKTRQVPLIIDNAYGEPFPDIIHTEVKLEWHENIILCMSLSKLGLPAVRTGVVIASEQVCERLARMNSIINLTPGSLGPAIVEPLFSSGKILSLSREHIRPFYKKKAEKALACFDNAMQGVPASAHVPEGAIFLWLWFENLPITSQQLYERLKERGVLVVPGHYFFPGLDTSWRHCHECIRISYAMDDTTVQRGIEIIADEVKKAHNNT